MRHLPLLLLFLALPFTPFCQPEGLSYFLSNQPRFLTPFNDTLPNAFAGGFKNPQFNNIDLNQDGIQDLVIFDDKDHRVLPFLNIKVPNADERQYSYAPVYENKFPQGSRYMALLTRDYHGDGKKDLFYVTTSSELAFYKNVSDSGLQFRFISDAIQAIKPWSQDTTRGRIFAGRTDIPGIADVDSDGDLDVLAFNVGGGYLSYYQNRQEEISSPKSDTFYYVLEDRCWGCFQESGGESNLPSININCNNYPRAVKKHAGSNILPFDQDGDGDMDLLYGDVGYNNLVLMKNGRLEYNHYIDTITKNSANFPQYDKPANMREYLGAFKAHIDGDSVYDLIVTPQAEIAGKSLNQVWHYKNTGTATQPRFIFQQDDLLQKSMLDVGSHSAPSFFDYNGDGIKDLLVATKGDYAKTTGSQDYLVLYENQNTRAEPVYQQVDDNYLDLRKDSLVGLTPATGDLDGDGDADLVLGNATGQLIYFENTAGAGKRASFQKRTNALDGIDIGRSSAPAIGDINGDGQNDLIIGSGYQSLYYYRKTGVSNGLPTYKEVTKTFGGIAKLRYSFLVPRLGDLDNNDSLDLILGTKNKEHLQFYFNFQAYLNDSFPENNAIIKVYSGTKATARFLGENLSPAIHHQDGDSFPDIMVGNARGGLTFLSSSTVYDTLIDPGVGTEARDSDRPPFHIDPNPVKKRAYLTLAFEEHKAQQLVLTLKDMKGRLALHKTLEPGKSRQTLDINRLESGLYIAMLKQQDGRTIGREKVLIME